MSEIVKKTKNFSSGTWLAIFVGIVLCAIAYYSLRAPDRRTTPEKIDDSVSELYKGADKARRELKDRTPFEKLNDAAKDLRKDLNQP